MVAAIFSNPYLLLVVDDIYRLMTNKSAEYAVSDSLIMIMSVVSFTALLVSLGAFFAAGNKRIRLALAVAVVLIILGWVFSQIFAPLGLFFLAVAAGIIVFGVSSPKRR